MTSISITPTPRLTSSSRTAFTSATTICSPFCDPGGMSVSPALASGICYLNPLEAALEPAIALLGWRFRCLKQIRGHLLLENSFHAHLHTLFCRRMREDIERFLADGIEDHLRYLGSWKSRLCQLAHNLYHH